MDICIKFSLKFKRSLIFKGFWTRIGGSNLEALDRKRGVKNTGGGADGVGDVGGLGDVGVGVDAGGDVGWDRSLSLIHI